MILGRFCRFQLRFFRAAARFRFLGCASRWLGGNLSLCDLTARDGFITSLAESGSDVDPARTRHALFRHDTTYPWSTDFGGSIYEWES